MDHRHGRIYPSQRNTNDAVPILGNELDDIGDDHLKLVRETEGHAASRDRDKDYRRRIKRIYQWLETNCVDYCKIGVKTLSNEEKNDPDVFHYRNEKDLVYEGMNPKYIKSFLSSKKVKSNGNLYSFPDIRKYKDAIQWGANQVSAALPTNFYIEMDKFLTGFKKETKMAKRQGKLDEKEADPISWKLYSLICQWAIENRNLLVWVFTIMQWNCMARAVNIGALAYHQFSTSDDNIQIKYDKSKKDQLGEKCNDKHIYANPYDPLVCPFLSLGIWFAHDVERLSNQHSLFGYDSTHEKAAQQTYCNQLSEIVKSHSCEVKQYVREKHMNAHGLRKGLATHATSGTTCPPSLPSICNRGEWAMGKVFDVYWHFCNSGDYYLGRVLCGLDPNNESFSVLPPHFNVDGDLMSDADIKTGMQLMYGSILESHGTNSELNPTGFLLIIFASVIYHSDWLIEKF